MDLQQFKLEGSRCFHLDVPGALLLVGERQQMRPTGSCSKLRKVRAGSSSRFLRKLNLHIACMSGAVANSVER
jgi:hypothetical protein